MNSKTELKKLRAIIEDHTKPPSELSGFFDLAWSPPSVYGLRPLWPLACFDLARLVELLELPERNTEQSEDVALRLAVAAKNGQLRELPPVALILQAVREEQGEREGKTWAPMARNGRPDGRPHPRGGPGLGVCGLYHTALDPEINWEAPPVVSGENCSVCGAAPFTCPAHLLPRLD